MPAIRWSDAEILRRAGVDEDDLALVLVWWQRNAIRRDREMLERSQGRPLPRSALDRTITRGAKDVSAQANALRSGDIALSDWQLSMADMVIMMQLASGIMAAGGLDRLNDDDREIIEDNRETQLGYLLAFALAIQSGEQKMDGRLARRSMMYAFAGRGVYHDVERERVRVSGFTEERRIRTARDSCTDCVDFENRGWQPIGSLPRIGESICLVNCLCFFEYRRIVDDVTVTASVGPGPRPGGTGRRR